MPTNITVTNPTSNEIVVSSSYLQNLGAVSRLGASQIEHSPSSTISLNEDIFFKFYLCSDTLGTKSYFPLDVSSAISNSTVQNRFLSMLFPQYYNDSTIVADIGGAYIDIAERLSGVNPPTNPLATTLSIPASASTNYVEFVGMGLGSYVGANFINGGSTDRPSQFWGTRVGQVHITSIDPTSSPVNAIYDNSDNGCWKFSDYGCDGYIVYTNLTSTAFSSPSLACWSQLLCVWSIIANITGADMACIFNNFDQSFMKSGLGFFDRASRINTFYGWSGNYLQSIFNDWGIPVVSPIWSLSDIALATYITYGTFGSREKDNYSSISSQNKAYRFVGPTADYNVDAVNEKVARSILPVLWANECRWGSSSSVSSAIPPLATSVTALGYASVADYISACLSSSSEGYNAHIYKYILNSNFGSNTPTATRSYINSGVSWSSKLSSQTPLNNAFSNPTNSAPRYYAPAVTSFYDMNTGQYGSELTNRIEDGTLVEVNPMPSTQKTLVEGWVYVP